MDNAEISETLTKVADLLEFQRANPFRIRAYRSAARAVHELPDSIEKIIEDPNRKLTDIGGIGKDLAEKITTLSTTGKLPILEELLAEIPDSALSMLRVAGLGAKRASILYNDLGVNSLSALRRACQNHRVQAIKGFGPKIEATILAGIDFAAEAQQRTLWAKADRIVRAILEHFESCEAIERIEPAGSYRRAKETVGDLDFLAIAEDIDAVMDHFAAFPEVAEVMLRGETKMSVRLKAGMQVDLRVVPAESFGAAWQYFTGSQAHNVVVRGLAKDLGLKVNEYGAYKGNKQVAGRSEEEVYAALGLPCFPPELREARREFDWAAKGELPELLELDDIRGDLHMHTTWSDGSATIEEMVAAAKAGGLSYVAITDHTKRAAIANGMDAERLKRQWDEIEKLDEKMRGITILKGAEVDILDRGGLDLDDKLLEQADWIIASVHFGQDQPREQITQRIVEALANPYVSALAHPTGRIINERKPYAVDLDAIMEAAAKHGVFLELNSRPKRLDLDDINCAKAKQYGIPVVISTDAHTVDMLNSLPFGVRQARRGGLTKADVANTRTWKQLQKLLKDC
ncbi:MAG: DNA polymerase/3'-5' exonuclease PolX [Pirellulales bacterium]|nr:DNA polymerase/3'-5' exonuclease PolX [Pirellulales bacterium]